MAWRSLCSACLEGDHDRHVRDWNIRPGLIGGAWCDCPGQPTCKQRADAAAERLLHELFPEKLGGAS